MRSASLTAPLAYLLLLLTATEHTPPPLSTSFDLIVLCLQGWCEAASSPDVLTSLLPHKLIIGAVLPVLQRLKANGQLVLVFLSDISKIAHLVGILEYLAGYYWEKGVLSVFPVTSVTPAEGKGDMTSLM